MNIALLGAESTGKSTLAAALVQHFSAPGSGSPRPALHVKEVLRAWCEQQGRTPLAHEQAGIAYTQAQAIERGRAELGPEGVLVADTTPLMTAIYSQVYFQDDSLLPYGLAQQARFDHTLVMALDLPWQPDGLLRDGPARAEETDRLLRQALHQARLPYQVVHGKGAARLAQALAALRHQATAGACSAHGLPWHVCAQCGDAHAERQLFRRLTSTDNQAKNL